MQAAISTKDYFAARCQAARNGNRIARTEDLLRMGPFLNGRMADDMMAFCKLVARRLKEDGSTTPAELQKLLVKIGESPEPSRWTFSVLSFLQDHDYFFEQQSVIANLIERRFLVYSATNGYLRDIERVILICLDRVVDHEVRHGYEEYLTAVLGWSVHRQQLIKETVGIHTPKWVQRDGLKVLAGLLVLDFGV